MILIFPLISHTVNFSEHVQEFLNSSMYAPSPLSAVFALQMLYGSPALLCHGKVSVCFRSPPSLSSLCKMLTVFSHPISLISFSCNVFCLVSQCIHAKGQYFKLFEYTKLLRYHYDRRPFCQNIFFFQYFSASSDFILYFCILYGFRVYLLGLVLSFGGVFLTMAV